LGGGISISGSSSLTVVNNTISNNYSPQGGGISYDASSPLCENNIIYGNDASIGSQIFITNDQADPFFLYSDIQGGINGIDGPGAGENYDNSRYQYNIDTLPRFIDPTSGAGNDYNALVANWFLDSTSSCLDAGDPDTTGLYIPELDIAGNPRILNGIIDMGAYEGPGELPDEEFLCADVNEDGVVNVLDIITIVNFIMGGNPDPFNDFAADVNADNQINVLDIIALANIIMQVPGIPCPCTPSVSYEGQVYNTVQIGNQCWFMENLNVGVMINGSSDQTDNSIIEKFCYDNDPDNCDTYGGMYQWPELMHYTTIEGTQGICPEGWHVSTDSDWKILEGTVDSQFPVGDPQWDGMYWRGFDAGGNLKDTGTIHWNPPNTGATNQSGFTDLPGGFYNDWRNFGYLHYSSDYWVASEFNGNSAWGRSLNNVSQLVYRDIAPKMRAHYIRCLQDCWPQPTQANAGPDQLNIPGTSTTLAGNTPTYGTGVWHIISGTGGAIADTTNPASTFTGVAGNAYSLKWTIMTQCGSSEDTVVISFVTGMGQPCPGTPTITYEGQTYNTVQIGDQCWLRENLNVGTKINSTQGGYQQQDNDTVEKYCYNNDEANCVIYGGLYEWPEAMQYVTTEGAQGICPPGWHIPTDNEWKILEGTVDSQYPVGDPEWDNPGWRGLDAGGNLKEEGTTHWLSPNTGATNSSGFTGISGGYRGVDNGSFYDLGEDGLIWSSSQYGTNYAWSRDLFFGDAFVIRYNFNKDYGFLVRCLKND